MRDRKRLHSERDDYDAKFDATFEKASKWAGIMFFFTLFIYALLIAAIITGIILAWKAWG